MVVYHFQEIQNSGINSEYNIKLFFQLFKTPTEKEMAVPDSCDSFKGKSIPECNGHTVPWNKQVPLAAQTCCTRSNGVLCTRPLLDLLEREARPIASQDSDLHWTR